MKISLTIGERFALMGILKGIGQKDLSTMLDIADTYPLYNLSDEERKAANLRTEGANLLWKKTAPEKEFDIPEKVVRWFTEELTAFAAKTDQQGNPLLIAGHTDTLTLYRKLNPVGVKEDTK